MIPYFQALFIQRRGMISALMIYGPGNMDNLNLLLDGRFQGRILDFWKMGSVWGVGFADFISSFINIP